MKKVIIKPSEMVLSCGDTYQFYLKALDGDGKIIKDLTDCAKWSCPQGGSFPKAGLYKVSAYTPGEYFIETTCELGGKTYTGHAKVVVRPYTKPSPETEEERVNRLVSERMSQQQENDRKAKKTVARVLVETARPDKNLDFWAAVSQLIAACMVFIAVYYFAGSKSVLEALMYLLFFFVSMFAKQKFPKGNITKIIEAVLKDSEKDLENSESKGAFDRVKKTFRDLIGD